MKKIFKRLDAKVENGNVRINNQTIATITGNSNLDALIIEVPHYGQSEVYETYLGWGGKKRANKVQKVERVHFELVLNPKENIFKKFGNEYIDQKYSAIPLIQSNTIEELRTEYKKLISKHGG